ncbi:MAG: methyltransferase domain-containing protein [candidate division WOR-3 bacterium]|nr:MAG: methyltransferase domain-containing protein [candidate division WOR-3 bacterium]
MNESPFDALARHYDEWYDGKGKVAFKTELAALRPLLPGLPKPWLEIGVGSGRFAAELGIEQGIDPSVELLALARKRGISVLWGEGEETPYPHHSFGTVFLLTTWAFLEDRAAVLKHIGQLLKPEGVLVNGYLDREGKWGAGYVEKGKSGHPLHRHARFATYSEVRTDIEAAGFTVTGTWSTLFAGPGGLTEVEEPKVGYVPGASFVVLLATLK